MQILLRGQYLCINFFFKQFYIMSLRGKIVNKLFRITKANNKSGAQIVNKS